MSEVVEIDDIALPKNWVVLPIIELGKAITGNTPPTKNVENYDGELPFIKPSELVDKGVISGRETISEIGTKYARVLPKGGVLVSCIGYLGKTAIAKREVAFNQQINAVVFNETVLPEYGFYYFQSPKFRQDLESLAAGTTISIVNKSKFESISIPVAPPEQQKRIVAKIEELFSHIDAGIHALKKAKQLLKQYRQSVLKAAVTGELTKEWREANKDKLENSSDVQGSTSAAVAGREGAAQLLERILKERRQKWEQQQLEQFKAKGKMPKDDKWKVKYKEPEALEVMPGEALPDSWEWVSVGQAFEVYVGATPSRKKSEYWGDEINWVSSGEVAFCHIKDTKEKITNDGLNNTSTVVHPPGTVMLGMIGEGKTRGQAAILDIYAAHNQNTAAIEKCVDEQSTEYLYYYLMQQYELTRKRGSGNNQKALNKTRVQTIEFPLPPLAEQKIIAVILMDKFSAIERLENEIDRQLFKTEKNKQSVLSHSFSGKISL